MRNLLNPQTTEKFQNPENLNIPPLVDTKSQQETGYPFVKKLEEIFKFKMLEENPVVQELEKCIAVRDSEDALGQRKHEEVPTAGECEEEVKLDES